MTKLATSAGFEPATDGLEIREPIEIIQGLSKNLKILTFDYKRWILCYRSQPQTVLS